MGDDDRLVAGIELGGTKCIAVMARGSEILAEERFPTGDPVPTIEAIARQIESWSASHGRPEALGIASFGPVGLDPNRADHGHITSTPKPGWTNTDLVGPFAARFGIPVGIDTDVAGAALAEYRWGAAQGCPVVLYLTVGTGVGGGVLVDGVPVHGMVHPEIGHIRVRRTSGDAFQGACPYHGDCLEGLASGPAIAVRAGRPGAELGDDDPIWALVASELAEAMATLMLTLSPQRILIGGGVIKRRTQLLEVIRARVAELLAGYLSELDAFRLGEIIRAPGLGDRSGPLGAVALAYRSTSSP